jgi:predicted RNA-binding Zn-ribbon protein involved in translation (DUF1610 family)
VPFLPEFIGKLPAQSLLEGKERSDGIRGLRYHQRMRCNRKIDPKSFDLTTECPECHYKIHPSEMMRLDSDHMRCPSCKQDVLLPKASAPTGTVAPLES